MFQPYGVAETCIRRLYGNGIPFIFVINLSIQVLKKTRKSYFFSIRAFNSSLFGSTVWYLQPQSHRMPVPSDRKSASALCNVSSSEIAKSSISQSYMSGRTVASVQGSFLKILSRNAQKETPTIARASCVNSKDWQSVDCICAVSSCVNCLSFSFNTSFVTFCMFGTAFAHWLWQIHEILSLHSIYVAVDGCPESE